MNPQILEEKPHDGDMYFGPECKCGSRRTRRTDGAERRCQVCDAKGTIRIVNGKAVVAP